MNFSDRFQPHVNWNAARDLLMPIDSIKNLQRIQRRIAESIYTQVSKDSLDEENGRVTVHYSEHGIKENLTFNEARCFHVTTPPEFIKELWGQLRHGKAQYTPKPTDLHKQYGSFYVIIAQMFDSPIIFPHNPQCIAFEFGQTRMQEINYEPEKCDCEKDEDCINCRSAPTNRLGKGR